ncbi:MAG TPA: leucine-rich repeat domain-containing protein [Bacilli bacterium]|nr:leucine-rich repeat domain-containing protein [Bacilli bacterium]
MHRFKINGLIFLPLLFALVACGAHDDTGGDDGDDPDIPSEPHWVTFNTHCDATLESVYVKVVETMPVVTNGEMMLAGWFLESAYENIVSFPYNVLADVTMHAKWTEGNPADFTFSSTMDNTGYIVTSYGGNAANVIIPSYCNSKPVLEIGEYLFANNGAIQSVTMPSMLVKINMAAFKNAAQLSSIVIPDNVTLIDTDAFSDCVGLQTIALPAKLEVVGNSAFEGTAVQSITLCSHLTAINSRAFADCANLRDVYLGSSTPPLRFASSFENTNAALKYKVDSSVLDTYKSNQYWSPFASQIVAR